MLLDQFGRELKTNKPILEEVAVQTVRDRYGSYPSQGLTPQRLATIFKEADQGDIVRQAELFEEMEEKDLHLGGVLQTRKLAVTGLEWDVLPASKSAEDKKIAAAAAEMLEYMENFEDALLDIMDAVSKGFSILEIMWDLAEGKVWAKELKWVHQRRFTFNTPTILLERPRLLTEAEPIWGEELLPNKFIVNKYRARSGATPRGGLLRPCAYMHLFKNYDIKDWVIFNELFSVPMRVGKYTPGAGTEEKEALKRAVYNLGVDAAAVISDNTIIELLESKRTGDTACFRDQAEYFDRAISKCILGHTGSADSTAGRLGGENASEAVRQDLLENDAKAIMKTIKFQLLKPWVLYNYGPAAGIPVFKLHFEKEEDQEKIAKVYGILVKDAGFKGIPESHIHDRFGIPVPEKGEKTLSPAATNTTTEKATGSVEGTRTQQNRMAVMINAGIDPTDAWIDFYLARLAPALQNARDGALAEVEKWLQSLPAQPSETEFLAEIENILGAAARNAIGDKIITDIVSKIYATFRIEPGVNLVFGGPDIRSINFLAKLDHFYTSSYLKNPDAQSVMRNFIRERYLENGGGLFGRGSAGDIAEFKNLLGQKVADLEAWQVRRIVDTSVQRTRNWASLNMLNEAGVAEVEVYEPTQDCSFCVSMNGKIISVAVAYSNMERQMNMEPDEYEADLRAANMEMNRRAQAVDRADYAAAAGMLPPYHPHCRGMVIKRVR